MSKKTLLQTMREMNEKEPSEERGYFILSEKNFKQFRKETKSFSFKFLGHKVKKIKSCPDDKIYLMSENDYLSLLNGLKATSLIKKNQSNDDNGNDIKEKN